MIETLTIIKDAFGNYNYIILYLICLVIAFVFMKGKRKCFLVPTVVISLVIMSPLFYHIWMKINDYAYWRTLWLIPVIPVCACVPALVTEKIKKNWIRVLLCVICIVSFCMSGSYLYKNDIFVRSWNADKLPDDVCNVANALLEYDEYPYVVSDAELSVYLRQYSGKIYAMYSRDIVIDAPSSIAKEVNAEISRNDGDYNKVAQIMLNYDYKYLVTNNENENKVASLNDAGFSLLRQINQYGIYEVNGNPTEIRTYNDRHQIIRVTTVNVEGKPRNTKNGYATVDFEYDKYGNTEYEFHLDEDGNGVADADGTAGYRRVYNYLGCMIQETLLGEDGTPVVYGYATRKCVYNSKKQLIRESYYDQEGYPMLRTDTLYAVREFIYNKNEQLVGERYYGVDGNLIIGINGYAGYDRVIDIDARTVTDYYIGIDGNPMLLAKGYAAYRRGCDIDGNIIRDMNTDVDHNEVEEIYLDLSGNEVTCQQGYSCVKRSFNDIGRIETECYYAYGEPFEVSSGYTGVRWEYDDNENRVLEQYMDADGALTSNIDGCMMVKREYNEKKQLTKEVYLDEAGKPTYQSKGYAYVTREYDEWGNVIDESYYDVEGKPTVTIYGYDEIKREYNNKQLIRESYYVEDKAAQRIDNGISAVEKEYDTCGYVIEERYYDCCNHLVRCSSGYSIIRRTYDDMHRVIEEIYYDEEDSPVLLSGGYAGIVRRYDINGNMICELYLDEMMEYSMQAGGYAEVRKEYNELRQILKESYYDENGIGVLITVGYAICERKYDDKGNVVLLEYKDVQSNPILSAEGYASVKREYNDRSQMVRQTYYDTDMNRIEIGEGYSGIVREYTSAGDITMEQWIDNKNNPIVRSEGYTTIHREYDDGRRLIKEIYLARDGNPVVTKRGFASMEYKYLDNGPLSLTYCYDDDGNLLEMGSSNLHDYLCNLFDRDDITIFISVKDDASGGFTYTLAKDFEELGLDTDLRGKYRYSYYAVISQDGVKEELGQGSVEDKGKFAGVTYNISSAGYSAGNRSVIEIDSIEYSQNKRGINIVVLDNDTGSIEDSVTFDTNTFEVRMTR